MKKEQLLKKIVDYYLESHDFNGTPFHALNGDLSEIRQSIADLVETGQITVNFGDIHPNSHIKAFEAEPIQDQIRKISEVGLENACFYPGKIALEQYVNRTQYEGKPFSLMLALGEPQLAFRSFDLSVLEFYRNDPRFVYDCDDVSGRISVTSKFYEKSEMRQSDQVHLQTFGFSYDSNMNRAAAVFLRYLHDLSPEHQQIWKAKLLSDEYRMHPDYWASSMGHWPEGTSVFEAFIGEMEIINEISQRMGRPPFFKKVFKEDDRPRHFGFLIRPTLKEFNEFAHLLDKMISENIDLDFFQNEVSYYYEQTNPDGTIQRQHKGSLTILNDWLNAKARFPKPELKEKMIGDFKNVRKLRQPQAHAVQQDDFDQQYLHKQRQLISDTFGAMRSLRSLFQCHPKGKEYKVPEWLEGAKICLF